jgi:hypothetical protein
MVIAGKRTPNNENAGEILRHERFSRFLIFSIR